MLVSIPHSGWIEGLAVLTDYLFIVIYVMHDYGKPGINGGPIKSSFPFVDALPGSFWRENDL